MVNEIDMHKSKLLGDRKYQTLDTEARDKTASIIISIIYTQLYMMYLKDLEYINFVC